MNAADEWEFDQDPEQQRLDALREAFRFWMWARWNPDERARCLAALKACRGIDPERVWKTMRDEAHDDREQDIADSLGRYLDRDVHAKRWRDTRIALARR